jgi:hypothetical protein
MRTSKSKLTFLALSVSCLGGTIAFLATPAVSQGGFPKGNIALQTVSPGYSQSGNANISGTMTSGRFVANSPTVSSFAGPVKVDGFLGVGRANNTPFNGFEIFGLGESATDFQGMNIKTASTGKPFYGYRAAGDFAYHYFDGNANEWRLHVQGTDILRVDHDSMTVGAAASSDSLLTVYGRSVVSGVGESGISQFSSSVSAANASAIRGTSTATSGPISSGVMGYASSPTAAAVYGSSQATSGGVGVEGSSTNSQGTGVIGEGGFRGVLGLGGVVGVRGEATGGYGVEGYSTVSDGVFGQTITVGRSSVFGFTNVAGANGGFFNSSANTGTGSGVIGQSNSATGWGVYAFGRSGASGTKSFRIDHPLDPENKYLLHYSAEGPEPLNIYSGTATTGPDGFATVRLPDYFSSINRDPRIQLTVDDDSDNFVMSKVVGGIKNGVFRIRTSEPNAKVYWEVKAVRDDAFVQRYGAPVETEKPGYERGKYQHPELYGAPAERGITFRVPPTRKVK